MVGYMIAAIVSGLLFLFARWTYVRDNRYRQQLNDEDRLPPSSSPTSDGEQPVDLTDKEDLRFIYRP